MLQSRRGATPSLERCSILAHDSNSGRHCTNTSARRSRGSRLIGKKYSLGCPSVGREYFLTAWMSESLHLRFASSLNKQTNDYAEYQKQLAHLRYPFIPEDSMRKVTSGSLVACTGLPASMGCQNFVLLCECERGRMICDCVWITLFISDDMTETLITHHFPDIKRRGITNLL